MLKAHSEGELTGGEVYEIMKELYDESLVPGRGLETLKACLREYFKGKHGITAVIVKLREKCILNIHIKNNLEYSSLQSQLTLLISWDEVRVYIISMLVGFYNGKFIPKDGVKPLYFRNHIKFGSAISSARVAEMSIATPLIHPRPNFNHSRFERKLAGDTTPLNKSPIPTRELKPFNSFDVAYGLHWLSDGGKAPFDEGKYSGFDNTDGAGDAGGAGGEF